MTNQPPRQLDPNTLGVLHDAGGRWSVVVADVSGPRPSIRATRRFDASDGSSIAAWLDSHMVSEVLAVAPASAVICRTCTLPDASPAELEQGLELQAEAHLDGIAPAYRTAMAVLPAGPSETNRSGVVLAWPESSDVAIPDVNRPVFFTADVAALGALLDAERPADPIIWVDRHSDSVAMAMTHANGAVLRATREHASTDDELTQGVQRAVAETALNVGHTAGYVQQLNRTTAAQLSGLSTNGATLMLPPELRSTLNDRVDGAGADIQWWSDYGVAVGALLARRGPLQQLTTMIDTPATTAPSVFHRVSEQLDHPRTAAMVVAVALLVIAISPLLFNGLRLAALKLRHGDLPQRLAEVERARQSLTMYDELETQAWPMTKLLSDITNCTPLGIELDVIRLRQGQYFTVAGQASPRDGKTATELVALMERQLRDTGIFSEVFYTWKEPTANDRYEFDLTANIVRPHRYVRYDIEQDFGRWTHEMRRNGDPPPGEDGDGDDRIAEAGDDESTTSTTSNTIGSGTLAANTNTSGAIQPNTPNTATNRDTGSDSDTRRTSPRVGGSRTGDNRDVGSIENRAEGGTRDPAALPEFLTEATIKTLSKQETINHLTKVSNAKNRWTGDDDTKQKLEQQWKMLMDHLKETQS